ncbi:hypothetical protein LCGC14_0422440, partial [marine sediment metagenome]
MILFHATDPKNVQNILKRGLVPSLAWLKRFPPKLLDHPILSEKNQKFVFLVSPDGLDGFVEDVLDRGKIGLKVEIPSNIQLTDLGSATGILVTRQVIPPNFIERMRR